MNKKADWDLVIRKAFYKGKDFSFFLPVTFFLRGFGKWTFLPSLFDKFIIDDAEEEGGNVSSEDEE